MFLSYWLCSVHACIWDNPPASDQRTLEVIEVTTLLGLSPLLHTKLAGAVQKTVSRARKLLLPCLLLPQSGCSLPASSDLHLLQTFPQPRSNLVFKLSPKLYLFSCSTFFKHIIFYQKAHLTVGTSQHIVTNVFFSIFFLPACPVSFPSSLQLMDVLQRGGRQT